MCRSYVNGGGILYAQKATGTPWCAGCFLRIQNAAPIHIGAAHITLFLRFSQYNTKRNLVPS